MELKHLTTFKQVAKMLNFSQAAEALHYAQPTVSAHIQALESELGVVLFNRLGRQIILTEAGKRLLDYAEQLTDLADEARMAIGQIDEVPLGDIRIGASESILAYRLPPILHEFQLQFPMVRLIINPVLYADLIEAVRNGQIDIALVFRETVDSDLAYEVLLMERLILVTSPHHPLMQNDQITVNDLAGETLLAPSLHCPYRLMFKRILDDQGVKMVTNYQFDSVQPIKQFASQNGGIALLPKPTVTLEVKNGELAQLPWAGSDMSIPIVMVWRPEKWEPAAARSLKNYLKKNLTSKQTTTLVQEHNL